MGYDRLEPVGASFRSEEPPPDPPRRTNRRRLVLLSIFAVSLIVVAAASATLLVVLRAAASRRSDPGLRRQPTQAIAQTCRKTRYPALCINYLLDFPGSTAASPQELVHISFNMTLQHLNRALYSATGISYLSMDPHARAAFDDCLELIEDSVDALSRALASVVPADDQQTAASGQDVLTWLSAALTNQDTCTEGLSDVSGEVKDQMSDRLKDLTELVSNCLAIFSENSSGDFSGVPIHNRRRLMDADALDGYPAWLSRRDRELLGSPAPAIRADIVVSKDGRGTYKTIAEAIKNAPEQSNRRTIIHVMAGRYEEENLKVGRKKWNLMFIGDGKGKTVITGKKSIMDKLTTFHTASFAATGQGFIARDMTFENYAGPANHQAVALRVGADHAVVYRCNIIGYQDTLYVHSNRQFYRECDIYGTVDFIFGNAAVVLQSCGIYARKPLPMQKNTITAQNRKDPNQNTGMSVHACRLYATPDLEAAKASFPTYLGRPWKLYSRVVYMLTYMADHINPRGWLEWNSTFALDTLYYAEYMNTGPGAVLTHRVDWPGYHIITSAADANRFTVAQFIYGSSWLPSTGVAFSAGLTA